MQGRGLQKRESGEGPVAGCEGESNPESSTFSGDEEEKGDGLEAKRYDRGAVGKQKKREEF